MKVQPSILRKLNERRVLNAIRIGKTVSRTDVNRSLNLTMPTVGKIVDNLMAQDFVREVGTADIAMGRPPMLLEINPQSIVAVGIDLGRTEIRTVCVNLLADVIHERTASLGDIHTSVQLMDHVEQTLNDLGIDRSTLLGIGFAAPGSRNPHPEKPQRIREQDLERHHHWHRASLEADITRRFGLPCWFENDTNAAVLGEMWFGRRQDDRYMVFVLADEGLGAGIAVDGQIYRGEYNVAGEFAHMIVDLSGDVSCECGRRGCMGNIATATGIRQSLVKVGGDGNQPLKRIVVRAEAAVEPEASAVKRTLDYLAVGIANLVQVIDPHVVIVGGSLFMADEFIMTEVNRRVTELIEPKSIELTLSSFGANAIAVGAATLVLQNVYDHTGLVVSMSPNTPEMSSLS